MQEALRQSCRRSARLLQRAAAASTVAATHQVVARPLGTGPDDEQTGAAASKRRRRMPLKQQQEQDPSNAPSSGVESLPALTSSDAELKEAAATSAPSSPPAKKPRGRPARAAAGNPSAAQPAAAAVGENAAAHTFDTVAADDGGVDDTAAAADVDVSAPRDSSKATAAALAAAKGKSSRKGAKSNSSSKAGSGPTRAAEQKLWALGFKSVAGVDEAGRGPLAGPVVAAAAVLPPDVEFEGLDDSKQMTEGDREALFEQLTTHPDVAYAVAVVDHTTIDEINILQAAMLAMQRAVEGLQEKGAAPDHLLIDGNRMPSGLKHMQAQLMVKGDATSTCIAAASVIAKVTRDRLMMELDQQYPQYGFAQHKGYGVPAHKAAIKRLGPCPIHRRSFEPVKSMTGWAGYGQHQKQTEAAKTTPAAEALPLQ